MNNNSEVLDLEEVHSVIINIIKDTKQMAETSQELEKKLNETKHYTANFQEKLEETKKVAFTDILTQLNNRAAFDTVKSENDL